jgi:xanthine dehydrogenase/oxidase
MSFYSLLKLNPTPSLVDIEESFDGNLCRCTGYRPIIDCTRSFSSEENSCDHKQNKTSSCSSGSLVDFAQFKAYDPNADLPFPSDLMSKHLKKPLVIKLEQENAIWIEPTSLDELLQAKYLFQNAKLIGGSTEIGVEMKFKSMDYRTFVNVANIDDLKKVKLISSEPQRYLKIGVNTTLTDLIDSLNCIKSQLESHEHSTVNAFLTNLKWFASTQIRNFATLAGNIVTGSPISDLNPILVATNAWLTIGSKASNMPRVVTMRNFFLGYRKIDLKPDELVLDVNVPLPENRLEIVRAYKQAKRKDDDIAITNACFRVKLSNDFKIVDLDASFGGLAPTTIYLKNLNEKTKQLIWGDANNLKQIEDLILENVKLPYSVPGAMPTYRRTLAVSFFTRFWHQVSRDLKIISNDKSVFNLEEIERDLTTSKQDLGTLPVESSKTQAHLSALNQTTGVAKYLDDIPKQAGELYAGLVISSKSHAYIKNVNPSKALALNGVHRYISHKGNTKIGYF